MTTRVRPSVGCLAWVPRGLRCWTRRGRSQGPSELFARTTITMMQTVVSSVWVLRAPGSFLSPLCVAANLTFTRVQGGRCRAHQYPGPYRCGPWPWRTWKEARPPAARGPEAPPALPSSHPRALSCRLVTLEIAFVVYQFPSPYKMGAEVRAVFELIFIEVYT